MSKLVATTKIKGAAVKVIVHDPDADGDPDVTVYVNGMRLVTADLGKLARKVRAFVAKQIEKWKARGTKK